MRWILNSLVLGLACGPLAHAEEKQPEPSGVWKWEQFDRTGNTGRNITLKMWKEDDQIVGTISSGDREVPIQNAKLIGKELSFKVVREFNGIPISAKYTANLEGNKLKGIVAQERNGENRTREWEATRQGILWKCQHSPIHTATTPEEMEKFSRERGCIFSR